MFEIPSLRPETRYGIPTADLYLYNRQYIVGYSYLFRQPQWAMELIDPQTQRMEEKELSRLDNFRDDLRIPEIFRATLSDYRGSGFDRGHLVSSADRLQRTVVNSETFLMTNMSPQVPGFNRGVWKNLEEAVRNLARQTDRYVEVYAICGPLFTVGDAIDILPGTKKKPVVVPDAFFKSVLAEEKSGRLSMWTFAIPNAGTDKSPADFLCPTVEVEARAGLQLWDRLRGTKPDSMRNRKGRMWAKPQAARFSGRPTKKRRVTKKKR